MGCFSYLCKKCNKPILSSSFEGEPVFLFLLQDGKLLQKMLGGYDSYGTVSGDKWEWQWSGQKDEQHLKAPSVCDLMFNHPKDCGIAAVHYRCFCGEVPTEESRSDPDQGWGYKPWQMEQISHNGDWKFEKGQIVNIEGPFGTLKKGMISRSLSLKKYMVNMANGTKQKVALSDIHLIYPLEKNGR